FFALPIAVGGMLLARDVILLISSNEFVGAAVPFAILMLGAAFSYLNSVFGFASVAVNKQSRLLKISIMTIILNVLINLFAIPHYGVAGAATATLITEIVACIGVYVVFRNQTGISVNFGPIAKMAIAALLMIPAKLVIDIMNFSLFVHFLTVSAMITLVYLATVVLLRGVPLDLLSIARRLTSRNTN
ncbi:MAG TPA: polysaccharide biosynthesis C-terminal domain-containing protein, partial [Candidatus Saccharimonadales bacterium]